MKKELVVIGILLLMTIPAVKSLFIPGGFTSHDLTHHVIRQISMDKLLSEGQFPPRWLGQLDNGYGYPLFLFNYPLPSISGQLFHVSGLGYVDSVKAVLFSSMVLSAVGMYLFLKNLLGLRSAAFLGAVFYLYAPLRFLNVYVSAAVGSALGLAIVSFIFWAILRNHILLGAIFLAIMILSHNVTALMFMPVVLLFAILFNRPRAITMILLGLGLSAWFWIPATFEKQYTRFDLVFGQFYQDQFPTLWQLIRSPWGYGLSHPQRPESGDMSYQIGLIHIAVVVFLGLSLILKREIRGIREIRVIGGFSLIVFFLSVFFMLKISLPLWENLPFLSLIQFPLRFQAWSVFAASIAAALLIKYLPHKKILFIVLLVLVIYANRNHWNINQVFDPGEDYYKSLNSTSTSFGEHLPRWGRIMDHQSPGKLEIVEGAGEVRMIRDQSIEVLAQVEAIAASKLRFNQFYFPGWEIKVDEEVVKFDYLTEGENYGLMIFEIPKGVHQVSAEFKNTPVRKLADGISIITVIIVIIILCRLLPRIL